MTSVKERTAYACGMKSLENNFYELCNYPTNFKFQSDDLCYVYGQELTIFISIQFTVS